MKKELISHNVKKSTIEQGIDIALTVSTEDGSLVGGLIAWQWGQCVEIEYLWVNKNLRGKNIGRELLMRLEELKTESSIKTIITNSFSFQAPEFYIKNGYQIVDTVTGYSDYTVKHFLKKTMS